MLRASHGVYDKHFFFSSLSSCFYWEYFLFKQHNFINFVSLINYSWHLYLEYVRYIITHINYRPVTYNLLLSFCNIFVHGRVCFFAGMKPSFINLYFFLVNLLPKFCNEMLSIFSLISLLYCMTKNLILWKCLYFNYYIDSLITTYKYFRW